MKELFTNWEEKTVVFLVALAGAGIIKFQELVKAVKYLVPTFWKKKKRFSLEETRPYLKQAVNYRFGFVYLCIKNWNTVFPMNGDGCRCQHSVEPDIFFSVSGSYSHLEHDDMLETVANESIKYREKTDKRFKVIQSGASSVERVERENNVLQTIGNENAWKIAYFTRINRKKFKAVEKIILYRGIRFRIYFQAPAALYADYEDLINYFFTEFYILGERSALQSERVGTGFFR